MSSQNGSAKYSEAALLLSDFSLHVRGLVNQRVQINEYTQ